MKNGRPRRGGVVLLNHVHTGKGGGGHGMGGELNQREGERGNISQSWVENTNMTECTQEIGYLQSVNSDKNLPQSPFTGRFF